MTNKKDLPPKVQAPYRIPPIIPGKPPKIIPKDAPVVDALGAYGDRPNRKPIRLNTEIRAACQREGHASIKTWIEIRDDPTSKASDRIIAARHLMEYGFGKPVLQIQAEVGKPGDFDAMQTEEEILAFIKNELGEIASKGLKLIADKTKPKK